MALDRLTDAPIDHNLRYLLAAVAAFRGRTDLAGALGNLDAIQEPCPSCRTVVFPSELQHIIERAVRRPRCRRAAPLPLAVGDLGRRDGIPP